MTAHPLRRVRPGLPHRGGAATGAAVLPAASFAAVATALAAAGHHLVFAGTASAAECLVAAVLLFGGALLRGPGRGSLPGDLVALALAQVSACGWFTGLSPAPTAPGAALHGELGGALYLAMTLVTAGVLRAAATSRSPLSLALQERLRAFAHRLRALMSVRITPGPAAASGRSADGRGGRDEDPCSEALVTGTGGRRGPP